MEPGASEQQQKALFVGGGGEQRALSLSRSRSRGRSNPSELLARKQQLLGQQQHQADEWADEDDERAANLADGGAQHRRSLVRRAKQFERAQQQQQQQQADESRAKSVEAKLESLSEMLKSHQLNSSAELSKLEAGSASGAASLAQSAAAAQAAKSIDDVYILLAKKEKDLQLAAELGKVLLEKNDELSKANERITEDYSHKLELLEQDKHRLKRKLDLLDGEYENRLIELQTDCNILKNQLDEQQQLARQAEKEKSKLIDDLVQQNQRLTSELVEATKSEELLSSQLEQLNERFNVRMSNRQDHVVQLDALKEEIQIVNQRKQDLERRLKLAQSDKGNLNAALDESGDKILLLENLLNERETKLSELLEELNELRDASSWLSNELESMISLNERLASEPTSALLDGAAEGRAEEAASSGAELESAGQRKRARLVEQLRQLRLKTQSRMKANEFMQTTRRASSAAQSARRQAARGANKTRRRARRSRPRDASLFEELASSSNRSPSSTNEEDYDDFDDDDDQDDQQDEFRAEPLGGVFGREPWKEEVAVEIFVLLNRYQATLQRHKDNFQASQAAGSGPLGQRANEQEQVAPAGQQQHSPHLYSPNSTDDSGISSTDDIEKVSGAAQDERLMAAAKEPAAWRRLLASLKALIEEMPCSTCQLMIAERADYEQLQKLHAKVCDELRRKNDELLALNVVKTEQETKLVALEERCAILSDDLSNCDKPKEEIVKLAWKARDEAVDRKNNAEISLAKTRIENMQISSQLMEVVQQKGELSQKLAQFEDDIHYMTQDSVKAKFTWEEYAENMRRSKAATTKTTNWTHQRQRHSNHSTLGGASGLSKPLAQLLNFSALVASTTTATQQPTAGATATTTTTTTTTSTNGSHKGESNTSQSWSIDAIGAQTGAATATAQTATSNAKQPSALDNLTAQPASLMRNFTSNRFNLKFWQRSSGEKTHSPTSTPTTPTSANALAPDKDAVVATAAVGTNNNHTPVIANNNNSSNNNNISNYPVVNMETQKVS